jgi:ketosteroid isomerase-like protein
MKNTNAATNEIAIKQLVENWAAAVRRADINSVLAHHSGDIVMYDVPPPFQSIGIDAYRKTWDLFFTNTRPGVFDIQELHINAGNDIAFCFAKMTCEDCSSGTYTLLDFRLTIGLQKINDEWTIVHEHHSIPAE